MQASPPVKRGLSNALTRLRKSWPAWAHVFFGPRRDLLHSARDEQNRNVGPDGSDPFDHLVAADIRHYNIADYQIISLITRRISRGWAEKRRNPSSPL